MHIMVVNVKTLDQGHPMLKNKELESNVRNLTLRGRQILVHLLN